MMQHGNRLGGCAAALVIALSGIALVPRTARADAPPTAQVLEKKSKLCARPIAAAERRHRIPGQLMMAVAAAESGRWSRKHRAVFAWPWTVTSGHRSWTFPTKAAAVAHVHALQRRGISNIDVGCMQVNLAWHADAFESVEQAFDPETNVAYAADLLSHLFEARRSWALAVGLYHSATPALQNPYKRKVMKLWNIERRRAAEAHRRAVIARFEEQRRRRLEAQSARN